MALSDFFSSGSNLSNYWNSPTNFSSAFDPSAYTTKLDFSKYGVGAGGDTSSYWTPSGLDTTGFSAQDFAKTFAQNFAQSLTKSAQSPAGSEDKYQKYLEAFGSAQKQPTAGGMAVSGDGWSSTQLTPNLSQLSYKGPTIQMAGVQGGDVPWYTKLGIGLGKAALGVGLGALTGGLGAAGIGAAGSAAGSAAFGAGGAAFNPAAFAMGSLI